MGGPFSVRQSHELYLHSPDRREWPVHAERGVEGCIPTLHGGVCMYTDLVQDVVVMKMSS